MKKLLLSLIFVLAIALSYGQSVTLEPGSKGLSVETAKSFTPIISDTTDIVYVVYDMTERADIFYYTLGARLWATSKTAVTTTPEIIVHEQYSYDGIIYVNLDTITYYGASADTTFHFVENGTRVGYPYLRLKITGDDSISTQLNIATGRFIK